MWGGEDCDGNAHGETIQSFLILMDMKLLNYYIQAVEVAHVGFGICLYC
jgi:hypothetical protein